MKQDQKAEVKKNWEGYRDLTKEMEKTQVKEKT